ncbi:replication protein A 70 kDa DNA-binding subunit [Thraustotheca clavata]|uniref:Replication protein A subunit n=1 Tax=Thraustotheca clavata TaxID=74557 RepID=A0A1V9ZHJ7_9STRA|nr:replication protein A 70 kDa DNA-binding subunit [Thraustotheca clavata]
MVALTPNAVQMLYSRQNPDGFEPWLQLIDLKKIPSASGKGGDRYRLMLSDGQHFMSGMLSSQLSAAMENGTLSVNCFIKLKDYVGNMVQGRKILILLGFADVQPGYERIGSPESIDKAGATTVAAPVQQKAPVAAAYQAPQQTYVPQAVPTPAPVHNVQANTMTRNPYAASPAVNKAPVVREDNNTRISDIASLNPYSGGKWTIKARVTSKSPIKNWTNARGQGKLCSVDLLDAKGGEIRCTMFNETVDKFYDVLVPNGIFYLSGGKIKMANRKFSAINNDYEVTLDGNSEIVPAAEDHAIQAVQYNFRPINSIEAIAPESTIDLIGIVKTVAPCSELTSKAGKQLQKRDITLVDDSLSEIKVTLWNERAQDPSCDSWADQVLAIKGCRVSDYGGRSIGTFSSTGYVMNPPLPEAARLLNWYRAGGATTATKSLSVSAGGLGGGMGPFEQRLLISDIKERRLGYGTKPDYITVKGSVSFIKHDSGVSYQACIKCQKKVVPDVAQNYNCEKCQTVYASCENRYILSMVIQDATGSSWASAFNDQGKIIMQGKSADEIAELKDTNQDLYDGAFKAALFKSYVFRMRCKAEPHQDDVRVKSQIVNVEPINYATESADLLEAIAKYN